MNYIISLIWISPRCAAATRRATTNYLFAHLPMHRMNAGKKKKEKKLNRQTVENELSRFNANEFSFIFTLRSSRHLRYHGENATEQEINMHDSPVPSRRLYGYDRTGNFTCIAQSFVYFSRTSFVQVEPYPIRPVGSIIKQQPNEQI